MLTRTVSESTLKPTRLAIRRTLVRHRIRSVVAGNSKVLDLDLEDHELDAAAVLVEVAAPLDPDSAGFRMLVKSMVDAGLADRVADGLGSRDPLIKARAVRVAGAMRMETLVPWIGPLLWSRDPMVRSAAARALGRIGGARSADALLVAIQRLGARPTLVIALGRAAPDLYLETVLRAPQRRNVHPAVAMAAGIRRRRTASFVLITQLAGGSRRTRVACSRALGWIGAPVGREALCAALADRDWQVRLAATKALGSMPANQAGAMLQVCLTDRNSRVQRGARDAIRKLSRRLAAAQAGG